MRLRWPRADAAASKKANFNQSLIVDWMHDLPASAATLSVSEATLLRIPTLVATLSPQAELLEGLLLGGAAAAGPSAVAADALVDTMLTYSVAYDIGAAGERFQPPWQAEEGAPVDTGVLHRLPTCCTTT